jgi:hypothetical protein
MSEGDASFPAIKAGAPVSTRLGFGARHTGESFQIPHSTGKKATLEGKSGQESPQPQVRHDGPVTDKDIDGLLKSLGLPPDAKHRAVARFLLRNHFVLDKSLVETALKVLPKGPWENHGPAEALVAAISRLPAEKVPEAFLVLRGALDASHPMVMGLLQQITLHIQDAMALWLVNPLEGLSPKVVSQAMEEELLQWQALLKDPSLQVRLLLERSSLAQDLRRALIQIQLIRSILIRKGASPQHRFLKLTGQMARDFRSALEILSSDSILSIEDRDHHFKEGGDCHSLGLWNEGNTTPCRLWLTGQEDQAEDEEDLWWFRVNWHDDFLDRLEAKVQVEGDDCQLCFYSDQTEVRNWLDENRENLEERINSLGYESSASPVQDLKSIPNDPKSELKVRAVDKLLHIDTDA